MIHERLQKNPIQVKQQPINKHLLKSITPLSYLILSHTISKAMSATNGYLSLYMLCLFTTALQFSSIGPLIPFLAEQLGIVETEYIQLFGVISIAFLLAAILFKALKAYDSLPNYHTLLIICLLEMFIFSIVFSFAKKRNGQILVIGILKLFSYILVLVVNLCLMMAPAKEKVGVWVSCAHGAFGVGSIVGPILVAFLGQKVFLVMAGGCLVAVHLILFCFMQSPEDMKRTLEQQPLQENKKEGSFKLSVLFCLAIFVLVGIESTLNNWMPTYAVQTKLASKEIAVQFPTLFWTMEFFFLIIFSFIPGKDSTKLTIFCWGQLIAGIISVLALVLQHPMESAYLSSILYGITFSTLFHLFLSVSKDFGIYFNEDQTINIISFMVSTGIFSNITGKLMKNNVEMFHYSLLAYSLILVVLFYFIMSTLREEAEVNQADKGLPVPVEEPLPSKEPMPMEPYPTNDHTPMEQPLPMKSA